MCFQIWSYIFIHIGYSSKSNIPTIRYHLGRPRTTCAPYDIRERSASGLFSRAIIWLMDSTRTALAVLSAIFEIMYLKNSATSLSSTAEEVMDVRPTSVWIKDVILVMHKLRDFSPSLLVTNRLSTMRPTSRFHAMRFCGELGGITHL